MKSQMAKNMKVAMETQIMIQEFATDVVMHPGQATLSQRDMHAKDVLASHSHRIQGGYLYGLGFGV